MTEAIANIVISAGNRENEWHIKDLESASLIVASTINGMVAFTQHIEKEKKLELMDRVSHIFLKGAE